MPSDYSSLILQGMCPPFPTQPSIIRSLSTTGSMPHLMHLIPLTHPTQDDMKCEWCFCPCGQQLYSFLK
eukprot:5817427-Ditylum_brightwellii.AAC.2